MNHCSLTCGKITTVRVIGNLDGIGLMLTDGGQDLRILLELRNIRQFHFTAVNLLAECFRILL